MVIFTLLIKYALITAYCMHNYKRISMTWWRPTWLAYLKSLHSLNVSSIKCLSVVSSSGVSLQGMCEIHYCQYYDSWVWMVGVVIVLWTKVYAVLNHNTWLICTIHIWCVNGCPWTMHTRFQSMHCIGNMLFTSDLFSCYKSCLGEMHTFSLLFSTRKWLLGGRGACYLYNKINNLVWLP